ncbi:MAG TPA: DUF4862 family protein [Mycobacteriales bacterium]|jgi:hypothetical protein|nr:DUF4862 family protein [Mycobacteriales bacterium]
MKYVIGAYTAYPATPDWDDSAESAFLADLAQLPGFGGLEVPFTGPLPADTGLFDKVDPSWDFVLTAIPGTIPRVAADPNFGLASPAPDGRREALVFAAGLRDAVEQWQRWAGRACVRGVEIHSAPTGIADGAAFTDSLAEIASWDWHGATVTVEHCDAFVPERAPQKGYLDLSAELAAIAAVVAQGPRTRLGLTVNWARSAIEAHDAGIAATHIGQAAAAGALRGLMFSGCSDRAGAFGDAWLDTHLPPAAGEFDDLTNVQPESLLTPDEVRRAIAATAGQPLDFAGLKIGVRPADASPATRVAYLRDALRLLDRALQRP